jgi:hypothetical protein
MKSMTQKPVGPDPHVCVGDAQMVSSKAIVMMLAERVGTCDVIKLGGLRFQFHFKVKVKVKVSEVGGLVGSVEYE